jgi:hypothetical protein
VVRGGGTKVWPFKRRVTNEEFVTMFGQVVKALRDVWEPRSPGMTVGEELLAPAGHYNALREHGRAFRKTVCEYEPYRPIHDVLNRLLLYELELIRRRVRAYQGLEQGQTDDFVNVAVRNSRVDRWEAQAKEELTRLIEALPESDPVRALAGTAPGARGRREEVVMPAGELWLRFTYGGPEEAYVGKIVDVRGTVREVGEASGSPNILFDHWPAPHRENVRCVFVEDDARRVATLSRGYDVTVRGTVDGFHDEAIELRSCTLEAASDQNIELATASELWGAYEADEVAAAQKYQKKVARVTGVIRHLQNDGWHVSIWLDAGDDGGLVLCMCAETEAEKALSLSTGDTVTVTGRVGGWQARQEPQWPACVSLADCTLG